MKLIIASLFIALSANAAESTITSAPSTPKQACELLAKAATEDNFKAFTDLTAMHTCPMHHSKKDCTDANCPMHHDKKDCTDKNCPMHKKGKDYKHAGTCPHHGHGKGSEEGFHKMHEKEIERLKDLTCKEEKIVGDHAWVEAVSKNESRLVPFKMQDGSWKFDMHTYHSFYPHAKMTETEKTDKKK
ncbi:MAG: hypothetical protein RJB66_372 [Pseudomonadota bacterium]